MGKDEMRGAPGEPGEPGAPGEPGVGGGGTGGHGGSGGRGGRGGHGTYASKYSYNRLIFVGMIIAVALSASTLLVVRNVDDNNDKIAHLQNHDRQAQQAVENALTIANDRQDAAIVAAREAEYRICIRQMVTRAASGWIDTLHDEMRLPLLNCKPNLSGLPAKPMTRKERQAFLRFVKSGKAP